LTNGSTAGEDWAADASVPSAATSPCAAASDVEQEVESKSLGLSNGQMKVDDVWKSIGITSSLGKVRKRTVFNRTSDELRVMHLVIVLGHWWCVLMN
jgi:hypothetical protein